MKNTNIILGIIAFVLFIILAVTTANAATCSTSQATFSITQAVSAQCISGDNDVGAGGYFAQDPAPTLFGYQGWTQAGPVDFGWAPNEGSQSGWFTIDNPTNAAYLVVLKAGNGFGAFDMGTQDDGWFKWYSSKKLSHATIWQKSTPPDDCEEPSAVPVPASGLLLIPAFVALFALRRKGRAA